MVVTLIAGLVLAGCATAVPVELVPGHQAAEFLRGTWVGDDSDRAVGTPYWLFVREVAGSTVQGEDWGIQEANRWQPFTGTIDQGELRLELKQIRQTLLLRPFDPGDGQIELHGRIATSPSHDSPIVLRRLR